jgi:hypothetical protein
MSHQHGVVIPSMENPPPQAPLSEFVIPVGSMLPPRYICVYDEDFHLTKTCWERAAEKNAVIYRVVDHDGWSVAFAYPRSVAIPALAEWRHKGRFRMALSRMFPRIPPATAEEIIDYTTRDGTGRVGTSRTLAMNRKVTRAVEAHIRTNFTPFERFVLR